MEYTDPGSRATLHVSSPLMAFTEPDIEGSRSRRKGLTGDTWGSGE